MESTTQAHRRSALKCVEELLDSSITSTKLLEASQLLSQAQYTDVVEERNIIGLCGYPLCDKKLGLVPQQKYHISVTKKQVIDLSQRKKFCSNNCFKCSNYFSAQLPLEPKWRRPGTTSRVNVKLLNFERDTQSINETTSSSMKNDDSSKTELSFNNTDLEQRTVKMSSVKKLLVALMTWHSLCPDVCATETVSSSEAVSLAIVGQNEQRTKIFYHQISRNLSTVCAELNVNYHEAHPAITRLINTFRLERNCVMFHPKEWKILITVLLIECGVIVSLEQLMETHKIKLTQWLTYIQATLDDLCTLIKAISRDDHAIKMS